MNDNKDTIVVNEYNVANMLPQVPVQGSVLTKNNTYVIGKTDKLEDKDITDIIDDDNKSIDKSDELSNKKANNMIMNKSIYEYVTNDNIIEIDSYVEESIKDEIINFKTKVDISRKLRVLSIEIAIMKCKLKNMSKKNIEKGKINDLKKSIISKEQEKRKLSKDLNPEEKSELNKIEKAAEKKAIEEFKDVEKEMDSEVTESTLTLNTDKGLSSRLSEYDDNAIRSLSNKLSKVQDKYNADELFDILKKNQEDKVLRVKMDNSDIKNILLDFTKNHKPSKKNINESTDDNNKEKVSPELKRLDEIRADISDIESKIKVAKDKLDVTGDELYEKKIKGLQIKLDKLKDKLSKKEDKLKKEEEKIKKEKAVTEAANMEDEIKPIVDKLNNLGYKVKYASPGHKNLRKKEDKEPDGVYYDRLYSDARIMFDDKYKLPDAPEYWHWRDVDGCSYLDISPIKYNDEDGTPDEAFAKWKENYMKSLSDYVDSLDNDKKDDSDETTIESIIDDSFNKFDIDSIFTEGFFNFGKKKESESDSLKKQIEQLKKDKAEGKISPVDFTNKLKELTSKYQEITSKVGNNFKASLESVMDDLLS